MTDKDPTAVLHSQLELADELCRIYWKERRRILTAAHKARWFERRVLKADMLVGMRSIVAARDRSPSQLARLSNQLKNHHSEFTTITAFMASRSSDSPTTDWPSDASVSPPIDDRITQALQKAEVRFIKLIEKAGWFKVHIPSYDITTGLEAVLAFEPYPASAWSQLKQKRNRRAARSRGNDVRRKVLLGGFVVAQCRHKPDLHQAVVSDIKDYLSEHPNPDVAEQNIAALAGFLADPHDGGVIDRNQDTAPDELAGPESSANSTRNVVTSPQR
ncbi:MAG: hypothetical protein OXE94_10375 [Aestuariivita sp.]|nr:hypothetical protein [Aestuariivita sp.]MCY4203520.1 hypothetical protein [Aestuariivita sp.]